MKFPIQQLSTLHYSPRDADKKANIRLFKIEKGQDNDDDYPENAIAPSKTPNTTISADTPILEISKEVGKTESYVLEIDELITQWKNHHGNQYESKPEFAKSRPERHVFPGYEETDFNRIAELRAEMSKKRGGLENKGEFETRKTTPEYKALKDELAELYAVRGDFERQADAEKIQADADYEQEKQGHIDLPPHLSHDPNSNVHFKNMPAVAQQLLTTLAKICVLINNIKLLYKSKISGSKLNRFNQTDMFKIVEMFDKFMGLCKNVANELKDLPRVILDSHVLKKPYAPGTQTADELRDVKVEFHHAYDKAVTKYIKQVNDLDGLYISDKERYSYNPKV